MERFARILVLSCVNAFHDSTGPNAKGTWEQLHALDTTHCDFFWYCGIVALISTNQIINSAPSVPILPVFVLLCSLLGQCCPYLIDQNSLNSEYQLLVRWMVALNCANQIVNSASSTQILEQLCSLFVPCCAKLFDRNTSKTNRVLDVWRQHRCYSAVIHHRFTLLQFFGLISTNQLDWSTPVPVHVFSLRTML